MLRQVIAIVDGAQSSLISIPTPSRRSLQLVLITFAAWAGIFARFSVSPLQESMRVALSLTDNQMALLQGPALALPMVIAAIPLGLLVDRHSRVRLLFIFAGCNIVGSLLTALTSNFAMIFAARCLIGLTGTATSVAAYSLLADLYAPDQRGRASMVVAVGEVAGAAAAFALGGALVTRFGAGTGWQWAMLWLTSPLALVLFSMLAMREPPRTGLAIANPSARQAITELWHYRAPISLLLIGRVMVGIADGAALIWAAPTLSRSFGLTPDRIGAIMATVLLVSGLVGPVIGGTVADLSQRTGGPRRTMWMLSGLALLSIPAGLFAVAPGAVSASILLVVFIVNGSATIVMVSTLTTVVIPNELRGLCMAVLIATGVIFGVGLAPVAVSALSDALGGPPMIGKALSLVCLTTSFLGAVTFACGRTYFPSTVPRQDRRC